MGWPTTSRMLSAAPPRASPSTLVRITPVSFNRSLKLWPTWTASWPVMASATNRISLGLTFSRMALSSSIKGASMCSRPAVSRITVS